MAVLQKANSWIPITGFQTDSSLDEPFKSIAVCSGAEDAENRGKEWFARKLDQRLEVVESMGTLHFEKFYITKLFVIIK
jgi:hypothetical protein